jgi:uncharacterized protein YkwD
LHGSRVVLLTLALSLAALVVPRGEPAQALDPEAARKELLALTNVSRTSNGLPSVLMDPRLTALAIDRSEDMIARDYFSHYIPPDGRTVIDLLESLGVRMRSGAENIAWNNALDFMTVQEASNDFMNSPTHRVNVLNPRWERVGTGAAQGRGRQMYAVVFLQTSAEETSPRTVAPSSAGGASRSAPAPLPEELQVSYGPTGLMDNIVNQSIRLFLNL